MARLPIGSQAGRIVGLTLKTSNIFLLTRFLSTTISKTNSSKHCRVIVMYRLSSSICLKFSTRNLDGIPSSSEVKPVISIA